VAARDFSTIGPSARSLLVMRAQTDAPFARQAAELLFGGDQLAAEIARVAALPGSELRRRHFVERTRSIDTLLAEAGANCILELAGGLSFRGLAWAQQHAGTYVDSDLPDMIATKRQLIDALAPGPLTGELRLAALEVLDAAAFAATVAAIPDGTFAIVNEGLLMYLDDSEKQRLAANIRAALALRGGVWITADVYLRVARHPGVAADDRLKEFLAAHRVEENKFASFAAAETFFTSAGFRIERRLAPAALVDVTRESWVLAPV
jgi:O-methyltransferase involved in polyketide biosynthesis